MSKSDTQNLQENSSESESSIGLGCWVKRVSQALKTYRVPLTSTYGEARLKWSEVGEIKKRHAWFLECVAGGQQDIMSTWWPWWLF